MRPAVSRAVHAQHADPADGATSWPRFGEPDYVIYNAGEFPGRSAHAADDFADQRRAISFERGEFVILGTEYAGEMKKGIFTIMNYLMPKQGVLSMHCSANEGRRATCRCSSACRAPARRRSRPTRAAG